MTRTRRGGHSVYYDAANRQYVGSISLGYGQDGKRKRRKVYGRTKTEVGDKLRTLEQEIETGVKSVASYTVQQCVADWMASLDQDPDYMATLHSQANKWIYPMLGRIRLKDLTAVDVDDFLAKVAQHLSSRTVQMIASTLRRSVRRAQGRDLVARNVVELVDLPQGQPGNPARAMNEEQVQTFLMEIEHHRLRAAFILAMTAGLRPGEMRTLRWEHLDLDRGVVHVWRSARQGGDTKTPESKRSLRLAKPAWRALEEHRELQAAERAAAGPVWEDHGLVFCREDGTPYEKNPWRYQFLKATRHAGLGDWHPHELRHTYASLLSFKGIKHQDIADSMGHRSRGTFEAVYRHNIAPEIAAGTDVMDDLFGG